MESHAEPRKGTEALPPSELARYQAMGDLVRHFYLALYNSSNAGETLESFDKLQPLLGETWSNKMTSAFQQFSQKDYSFKEKWVCHLAAHGEMTTALSLVDAKDQNLPDKITRIQIDQDLVSGHTEQAFTRISSLKDNSWVLLALEKVISQIDPPKLDHIWPQVEKLLDKIAGQISTYSDSDIRSMIDHVVKSAWKVGDLAQAKKMLSQIENYVPKLVTDNQDMDQPTNPRQNAQVLVAEAWAKLGDFTQAETLLKDISSNPNAIITEAITDWGVVPIQDIISRWKNMKQNPKTETNYHYWEIRELIECGRLEDAKTFWHWIQDHTNLPKKIVREEKDQYFHNYWRISQKLGDTVSEQKYLHELKNHFSDNTDIQLEICLDQAEKADKEGNPTERDHQLDQAWKNTTARSTTLKYETRRLKSILKVWEENKNWTKITEALTQIESIAKDQGCEKEESITSLLFEYHLLVFHAQFGKFGENPINYSSLNTTLQSNHQLPKEIYYLLDNADNFKTLTTNLSIEEISLIKINIASQHQENHLTNNLDLDINPEWIKKLLKSTIGKTGPINREIVNRCLEYLLFSDTAENLNYLSKLIQSNGDWWQDSNTTKRNDLMATTQLLVRNMKSWHWNRTEFSHLSALGIKIATDAVDSQNPILLRQGLSLCHDTDDKTFIDKVLAHVRTNQDQLRENIGSNSQQIELRLIKTLAEANTHRGNEVLVHILGTEMLGYQMFNYVLSKLIENGHLEKDILSWWQKNVVIDKRFVDRNLLIKDLQSLIGLGITPNSDAWDWFLIKDWGKSSVEDRVRQTHELAKITDTVSDQAELIKMLTADRELAMAYYLTHKTDTKFDLINTYSFRKFHEMLNLVASLEKNHQPIDKFHLGLIKSGWKPEEADRIVENLQSGHHPFFTEDKKVLEIETRLDISNMSKYESAQREMSHIFGSDQLGLVLKSIMYRRYLGQISNTDTQTFLNKLSSTAVGEIRSGLVNQIESLWPDFKTKIVADLKKSWATLDEKLSLGVGNIENLLFEQINTIDAPTIVNNIEHKRAQLRQAKKELLDLLRHENPNRQKLERKIIQKQKHLQELQTGLEKKPGDKGLKDTIKQIETGIRLMQSELNQLGNQGVNTRYAQLSITEKEKLIIQTKQEILGLDTKNPSEVLMYSILEMLGEDTLIENDIEHIKDVASNLQGPMQICLDLEGSTDNLGQTEQTVSVRWIDKKELLTAFRFADSKICCFSSVNYDMIVNQLPNKYWVASINKDPLSFIFEIEQNYDGQKHNLGFVFGNFCLSPEGLIDISLNGVYLSTGNDVVSATSVLNAIENVLGKPIKANRQAVAGKYGGKINGGIPFGYQSEENFQTERLRAITKYKSTNSEPESIIYDDLGVTINSRNILGRIGQSQNPIFSKDL